MNRIQLNKEGKYVLPYEKMIELWNFYDKNAELHRAGEILINKSLDADFSFQWGVINTNVPSFYDTIKASLDAVKQSRKNGKNKRAKGKSVHPSASLFDIMEQSGSRKDEKKKGNRRNGNKNEEESKQSNARKALINLDAHTIYKDIMNKMRPPVGIESVEESILAQYQDKVKEKATGTKVGNLPKGDVDHRGDFKDMIDKSIAYNIASIASGELPQKLPKKSAIVSSEDSPEDLEWMREFMKKCLKYKLIFGMVPYSSGVDRSGRKRLFVRDVSEGEFVVYRNENSEIVGYWQHKDSHGDGNSRMGTSYVYIWPNNKPRLHMIESPFNSPTDRLMGDYLTLINTRRNKIDADWLAAHVPVATKCTEKLVGLNEMTSEGIFNRLLGKAAGGGGSLMSNSADKMAMEREHMRRSFLVAAVMNNPKSKAFMMRNIQKEIGESGRVEEISRGMEWENQKMHIPYGREPVSITLPRSPGDYKELKKMFEELVSMTIGVPLREISGGIHAKTTKGEEGIQAMFNDAIISAREEASRCIEDAFTIAFGQDESNSIKTGLDNTYRAMNAEMRAINYYETIYGFGLDNPTKAEKVRRDQEAAKINDYVYGKAFEVIQMALDDAVTLDPGIVRQHIKDMISVHRNNVDTLQTRVDGLWNAHKSQVRLKIIWKPSFSKELMSFLVEGYNIGFIDKEAGALWYLHAMGEPLDTPRGKEKEERMEIIKATHAKEMENIKQQHELEKIRLQARLAKDMEKLKVKIAPVRKTPVETEDGTSSSAEKRKGEKDKYKIGLKKRRISSKSITETTPVLSKEAKESEKLSSSSKKKKEKSITEKVGE